MPNSNINYNPVPSVAPTNSGVGGFGVSASPADFGAAQGQAVEKLGQSIEQVGQEGMDIALKQEQIASESKANDTLVNQWSPTAFKLRNDFDALDDNAKGAGYDQYLEALKAHNKQILSTATSPLEKQALNSYLNRHLLSETQSALSEMGKAQERSVGQNMLNSIQMNTQYATKNYNDPAIVKNIEEINEGRLTNLYADTGHDLNNPESSAALDNDIRNMRGELGSGLVNEAIARRDTSKAYELYSQYSQYMPGYERNKLTSVLHTQALQDYSVNAMSQIKGGNKLPTVTGSPAPDLQAHVANTAHQNGVNPNTALAYIRIESTDGTNLGERGTIVQDKLGGTRDEQVARLPGQIKENERVASNALGRQALPWEGYFVHQQGVGGGPALLKAAEAGDTRRAVDILAPMYKSDKDPTGMVGATNAVKNNGGAITMTAGDFTKLWKQRYEICEQQAACDFSNHPDRPGDAIMRSQDMTSPAIQPQATPIQSLKEYDEKSIQWLEQIKSIPNLRTRASVMEAYRQDRAAYEAQAQKYTTLLLKEAESIAYQPNFISMQQVPAELYNALKQDSPKTLAQMRELAEKNINHPEPLNFANAGTLGAQIANRYTSLAKREALTGRSLPLFSKEDKIALGAMWDKQDVKTQANFLATLQDYMPDKKDYRKVVQQIRPDSPVTAMAGAFMSTRGEMKTESKLFGEDVSVTPDVVAEKLLLGESLLNPTSGEKKEGGSGKVFPMPKDEGSSGLRAEFNNYVKDSLRGNPNLYSYAYQSYRAYYAAEASQRGIYNGELDANVAKAAAKAVVGNVIEKNDAYVVAPWGMDETEFNDLTKIEFDKAVAANNFNPDIISWDDVKLQNLAGGDGVYQVGIGDGYLLDKEGNPIILRVEQPSVFDEDVTEAPLSDAEGGL